MAPLSSPPVRTWDVGGAMVRVADTAISAILGIGTQQVEGR
eukprot:CAMPEP_0194319712 /NCGR_PEP_ID=MMETSP0171-20130528/16152_1 /TAXON_ID=218684 /ORGANISM="Corethron pennatum, Strain L29A3" /LENGTH=40 /DNA_ID= /DNA_START= /DNA_END= /DNA_ORIENTATION=